MNKINNVLYYYYITRFYNGNIIKSNYNDWYVREFLPVSNWLAMTQDGRRKSFFLDYSNVKADNRFVLMF